MLFSEPDNFKISSFIGVPKSHFIKFQIPLRRLDVACWIMSPETDDCDAEDSPDSSDDGAGVACIAGCGATITLTDALRLLVLVVFPENESVPENT